MVGRLSLVLALLTMACGGAEGQQQTEPAPVCEAGRTAECACPGGLQGAQSCADDGSGWGGCECPKATAGSGGATTANRKLGYYPGEVCTEYAGADADTACMPPHGDAMRLYFDCNLPADGVLIGCEPLNALKRACCFVPQ